MLRQLNLPAHRSRPRAGRARPGAATDAGSVKRGVAPATAATGASSAGDTASQRPASVAAEGRARGRGARARHRQARPPPAKDSTRAERVRDHRRTTRLSKRSVTASPAGARAGRTRAAPAADRAGTSGADRALGTLRALTGHLGALSLAADPARAEAPVEVAQGSEHAAHPRPGADSAASDGRAVLAGPVRSAQLALEDLAGGVARQRLDDVDRRRALEPRQVLAAVSISSCSVAEAPGLRATTALTLSPHGRRARR